MHALQAVQAVRAAGGRWREVAREFGVNDDEIALMARAFEHEANVEARDRIAAA